MHLVEVHSLAQVGVRLQQAHDDRHGGLVVAKATEPGAHNTVQVQLSVGPYTEDGGTLVSQPARCFSYSTS